MLGIRFPFSGSGKLAMKFEPAWGGEALEYTVLDSLSEGIAMEMYNSDESIRGFALACLNYCLELV
jgi:isocitrate dehydrogenase